ncbi:MAG: VTT domain-containing protein [Candidatus Dormibacteraeota bacterium]|nr:VTT domain-containing protein [Candidatus Dormibacteraeota bacterium]
MIAAEPAHARVPRRALITVGLVVAGLAVIFLAILLVEGWTDTFSDFAIVTRLLVTRYSIPTTFGNLYVEESGLPVALPSDVLVANLGREFRGRPVVLIALWAGLVAGVVAGSTNLYLVSRRWGPAIARSRLGFLLHLTPERLERSERWFRRWGPIAILIGRHVIGLHVPLTAAAGTLRMPYRTFVISVAVTTAPWAALLLWLGTTFGDRLIHLLGGHPWASLLLPLGVVLALLVSLVETLRSRRSRGRQGG